MYVSPEPEKLVSFAGAITAFVPPYVQLFGLNVTATCWPGVKTKLTVSVPLKAACVVQPEKTLPLRELQVTVAVPIFSVDDVSGKAEPLATVRLSEFSVAAAPSVVSTPWKK